MDIKKYQELKKIGKLKGTIKDCIKKRENRDKNIYFIIKNNKDGVLKQYSKFKQSLCIRNEEKMIYFFDNQINTYDDLLKKLNSRAKNWNKIISMEEKDNLFYEEKTDWGVYSKKTKYPFISRNIYYTCYAVLYKDGIYGWMGDRKFQIKNTKKWKFGVDSLGFKIYNTKNRDIDFHFYADDLINFENYTFSKEKVIQKAIYNHKERLAIAKEKEKKDKEIKKNNKEIERIKKDNFYIIKSDSLEAKNCQLGTEKFIKNYNIKKNMYRYKDLIKIKEKIKDLNLKLRIENTINKSIERILKSKKQGFTNLKELY